MTPKCQSSDARDSDVSKRSHKVLLSSEKVKVLDLRREKNCMLRLLRDTVRINLLPMKL